MRVERGGPGGHAPALDADRVEAAPEADHHAANAAIAHDEVRADAHGEHRDPGVECGEKLREIALVGGLHQPVGRPADPQPGQPGERVVAPQAAAQGRQIGHGAVLPRPGREVKPPVPQPVSQPGQIGLGAAAALT